MESRGGVHSPAAHPGKDGPGRPYKNAYARLVQKHHSGRFRSYLNHIAQKLQLEGNLFQDLGPEVELSPKRGPGREDPVKNGMKPARGPPAGTLQSLQPDLRNFEGLRSSKEEPTVSGQQPRHGAPGAGKREEEEEEEGEEATAAAAAEEEVLSNRPADPLGFLRTKLHREGGQEALSRPPQKTPSSGDRSKVELWKNKGSSPLAPMDGSGVCPPAGPPSLELPSASPWQIYGELMASRAAAKIYWFG